MSSSHHNTTNCTRCGTTTTQPIYDQEQVAHLGNRCADPYCSTECLDADAEAYADHTYGGTR